jgi:hypothetical protein
MMFSVVMTTGRHTRDIVVNVPNRDQATAAAYAVAMTETPNGWHYAGVVRNAPADAAPDGSFSADVLTRFRKACKGKRIETRYTDMGMYIGRRHVESAWYRLAAVPAIAS